MQEVLFCSSRPLERAENVKAAWDAYDGGKRFAQIMPDGTCPEAERAEESGRKVIVTDEFLKTVRGKDRCKVVMVEHGLYGGKLYGLDQRVRYYTPAQTAQVDYFAVPSEAAVRDLARCAGIPEERCIPLGMPRTDSYAGKRKGDGGTFLAKYRRAYLFAPTLRAGWEPKAPRIDWEEVDGMLDDGEVLAVKRHMVTRGPLLGREYAHVVEVSPDEPSTPYLVDCDVVATDYSSILFDGYLLGKPCVLLCPDMDEYVAARGMYWDYPREYSPYAASTPRELVSMLREAADTGLGEVEAAAIERSAGACDGNSARRVAELVRSLL